MLNGSLKKFSSSLSLFQRYQSMHHYRTLEDVQLDDVWLTIGSFDGVHRGHQSILIELISKAQANHGNAVVITFYPHPAAILRGRNLPFYLNSPEEKANILGAMGIDVLITHPFNREVANTTSRRFILDLKRHLDIRHLQIGYDFALGKDRSGDFSALKELGIEFNFSVQQNQQILYDNDLISSSRIRFLLGVGQVREAASLIGRNYSIEAIVEIGDQRGLSLGFPTANMAVWNEKVIPTAGVYACWAKIRGKTWGAVTNIGVRPTFESSLVSPRVETHILDFNEKIYGEIIRLEFVSRLRNEVRFPSVDALVDQIQKDAIQARKILFPGHCQAI